MKWGIRESVDVYFKALSMFKLGARTIRAGEPVLILDTVKTSTMETSAEISHLTGGRGNAKILSFEGEKALTFSFEEALLSAEGLAILAGADLIPARNKNLPGAGAGAQSIVRHYTEKYQVVTKNDTDDDANNSGTPKIRGGQWNVWTKKKPYLGSGADIYVMLLDNAGERSGAPIQINLKGDSGDRKGARISKFKLNDKFVAYDIGGKPMKIADYAAPDTMAKAHVLDDQIAFYVEETTATADIGATDIDNYLRQISNTDQSTYDFLQGQPKCYKEGSNFVYKLNVPSVLQSDVVLIDYYVEERHNATQVDILPDKFAPFVYVEGSSLLKRASDGIDLPVEFVIPKFKITTALSFTMSGSGDPSTFNFQGDAYPATTKFDRTKKVLASIQILDADDNFDLTATDSTGDPTSYRRFQYDDENAYLWKDPSILEHSNINYQDTGDYVPTHGGAATTTPGKGKIDG